MTSDADGQEARAGGAGASPGPITALEQFFALAQRGDVQPAQELVEKGLVAVRQADGDGITALHWAAINDQLLFCQYLLQHGAAVDAVGGSIRATPLLWAAK